MSSRRPRPLRRLAMVAALVFSLPGCGGGGADEPTEQRAAIVRAVDARMRSIAAGFPAIPGMVVQVFDRSSGLAWAGSTGLADRASARALTPNASFRISSVTKVFTAAAVFRLIERGQLAASDPIERHLSAATLNSLRQRGYDPARMTVDHLLSHRAGLPDHALSAPYLQAVAANPAHRWTRAEQLAVAMELGPPLAAPGTAYTYSDTGYLLLGELIERLTGQQLGAAYRTLLGLAALGLVSTYQESIDAVPAAAGPRARQDLMPGVTDAVVDASADLWGSGGLVSDARDLALFMRALVEGRVLGAAATQAMMSVASSLPAGPGQPAYARGLARVNVGAMVCWGHDAFSGAFSLHCPAAGITVAGTVNATDFVGAPEALVVAMDLASYVASATHR